jgi:hypothetical protein
LRFLLDALRACDRRKCAEREKERDQNPVHEPPAAMFSPAT